MYWLDTTLLTLLVMGAALGFLTGFLWQVARMVSLGLALAATILFHAAAAQIIRDSVLRQADPRVVQVTAYVLVFLVTYVLLYCVARLIYEVIRATDLLMLDRIVGALFGAGKMALLLGAFCLASANYPHATTREWMAKSTLAPVFADGMEHVLVVIPEDYKENLRGTLVSLRELLTQSPADENPESRKDERWPFLKTM